MGIRTYKMTMMPGTAPIQALFKRRIQPQRSTTYIYKTNQVLAERAIVFVLIRYVGFQFLTGKEIMFKADIILSTL